MTTNPTPNQPNPTLREEKCNHQFWKDCNPPGCLNCGKTEQELLVSQANRQAYERAVKVLRKNQIPVRKTVRLFKQQVKPLVKDPKMVEFVTTLIKAVNKYNEDLEQALKQEFKEVEL